MSELTNKPILLEIDNVRIRRWDDKKCFIERGETYFSPKDKSEITNYKFKGYSGTVFEALRSIHTKGLLVSENGKQSIESLLEQIELSEKNIINEIRRIGLNG